ncbi:MAG: hypothetical protein SFX73_01130 [Kofleriaceae bacterium]|nr:hypothetical protein [Kofleriaceae bacterium]
MRESRRQARTDVKPADAKKPAKAKAKAKSTSTAEPAKATSVVAPKPEKAKADPHVMIFADEARTAQLTETISMRCVSAKNAIELVEKAKRNGPAAVFIDVDLLPQLKGVLTSFPVVGVVDESPAETLSTVVKVLDEYPALSNVISVPLLTSPQGKAQLDSLLERLAGGLDHDLLSAASVGRVAVLAQASHREQRFQRMQGYFTKQGVSGRTIAVLHDLAEELVMNALYNAPTEAGYFKAPVSRTEDVTLPLDRACEISYGMEGGNAFIRLRDTFGSLRRERLVEVLRRCNSSEVALDESNGGAGLGLWRIFSTSSTVAITVIPNRLTDVLIRVSPKQAKGARQLLAVHLSFFVDESVPADPIQLDQDSSMVDHSITMMQPGLA